jgi:hypothetical protein
MLLTSEITSANELSLSVSAFSAGAVRAMTVLDGRPARSAIAAARTYA